MKPILALSALALLGGCASLPIDNLCTQSLRGLSAAQDIAAVLVAHGYAPEQAAKAAQALALAQVTAVSVCAAIKPAVVVPGQ